MIVILDITIELLGSKYGYFIRLNINENNELNILMKFLNSIQKLISLKILTIINSKVIFIH
jgi:hypothetical protein